MDNRHMIGKGSVSSSSPARGASRQGRFNRSHYHGQGPSSYNASSYYREGEGAQYLNHELNGPSRFEDLEIFRAELLQKLDELKDHLSRSCEVTDEPRHRMGAASPAVNDPYPRNHAAYVPQEGLKNSHGVTKRPLAPGLVPYTHTYSSGLRESYRGYRHDGPSYADTYQHEMPPGLYGYGHPQSQYLNQPYHERGHGYWGNVNHPDENFFHSRTCSCVHCFDKNLDLPAKVDPSFLYNQRSPHAQSNPNYDHHMYRIEHGPQGYRSGGSNIHSSHSQSSIAQNSTELDCENDGIHQSFPRKMEEARRNVRMMHPVAGGAPFIACSSCFELLRLPRKHISMTKRQQKLKCGACSSIMLLELGNKALTAPVSGSSVHVVTEMDDCSSSPVNENNNYRERGSNLADTYACSDSNDDSLLKVSQEDKKSNYDEYEKQLDPLSVVSTLSKDEQMPDTPTPEKYSSLSAELHVAKVELLPHPILSSEECPDHCSDNVVVGQSDKENKGARSEFAHNVSWQNSVRESAVSTDIDTSSKEYPKSCISQDTWNEGKEQRLRDDEGAESSSGGLNNSRSGDFMNLAQNADFGTSQVFVNGHLIPERLVQKAELLAGPILPGDYWYDIRAGFWGVMGFPCLGIIMPNIEEFNYPMLANCAAGNTEVFVNGRELHQKDLDLLAGRGLPETRGRSYLIEISGEVVDEDTGEELDSIGKLAPTVERAKHGFGMKVPRFISRLQSCSSGNEDA